MFGEDTEPSSRIRVKICGITNAADALAAIDCGADALGFNFFPGSKRYLDIHSAESWLVELPAAVVKVAVLVNPTWAEAIKLAELPVIDALQLHGNESPAFCEKLAKRGIRFAKALPVNDRDSLREIPHFFTETILLDSSSPRGFGGSGETFPWAWGRRFVENHLNLKVILAGGLTPENVAEAVRQVGPFGVDVSTGVESSPGRKDRARLRAFITAARGL
jgi:phosphoribosylanthranilate isomerase